MPVPRDPREDVERAGRDRALDARDPVEPVRRRARGVPGTRRTIASTSSCGPVSASIAATWLNDETHETELMISFANGSTSAGGRIA